MLARILDEVGRDTRFLSVSLLTDDRAAEEMSKEHCGKQPKLRLALGPDAPLVGTLGIVCFSVSTEGGFSARFVPDKRGSLSTRDGNWVFSYRSAEHGGPVEEGSITLKMKVTSDDPRFQRFSGKWATVRFNIGTGAWELPPDDKHNREIYGRIEQGASDLLPRGVRIYNLRIGSRGVEVSIDPAKAVNDAAERIWHAIGDDDAKRIDRIRCRDRLRFTKDPLAGTAGPDGRWCRNRYRTKSASLLQNWTTKRSPYEAWPLDGSVRRTVPPPERRSASAR